MAGKTAPAGAKKVTPATAKGESSGMVAPTGLRAVPTVKAAETVKAGSTSKGGGGFKPSADALTKRNTLKARIIGAPSAPDVIYRARSGRAQVQRVEGGWRLDFLVEGSYVAAVDEAGEVALFDSSDRALNFAARALGVTDKELDVTGGRGA